MSKYSTVEPCTFVYACVYMYVHCTYFLQPTRTDEVFRILLNNLDMESKIALRKVCVNTRTLVPILTHIHTAIHPCPHSECIIPIPAYSHTSSPTAGIRHTSQHVHGDSRHLHSKTRKGTQCTMYMYMYIHDILKTSGNFKVVEVSSFQDILMNCGGGGGGGGIKVPPIGPIVAQLAEHQPRTLKVMGSSPSRGSNFSLKGCCLGI